MPQVRRCPPFRINLTQFKIIIMFELSESQSRAFDLMKSGRNVFLTGEAGSGKTTVVREFLKQAHDAVVVAPTGIAAINSGGQTIHSFFMLKPCLLTPDSIDPIYQNRRSVLKKVRTLVIDEISMVRSDVFAAIDFRLR